MNLNITNNWKENEIRISLHAPSITFVCYRTSVSVSIHQRRDLEKYVSFFHRVAEVSILPGAKLVLSLDSDEFRQ